MMALLDGRQRFRSEGDHGSAALLASSPAREGGTGIQYVEGLEPDVNQTLPDGP